MDKSSKKPIEEIFKIYIFPLLDVAPEIPAGNPNRFGGVWSTGWCESRP